MNTQGRFAGFSLIEMMITVALMAIVLTLAVPSFRDTIAMNRTTHIANELTADLALARSEAIRRHTPVTVCKRNAAGDACDNSAEWSDGWLVFADPNPDGLYNDNANGLSCEPGEDCLLALHEALAGAVSIKFPRNRVTYDTRGNAEGFNGTFKICNADLDKSARGRILSGTGRLKTTRDSDGDGTHEDSSGNELQCP